MNVFSLNMVSKMERWTFGCDCRGHSPVSTRGRERKRPTDGQSKRGQRERERAREREIDTDRERETERERKIGRVTDRARIQQQKYQNSILCSLSSQKAS